MDIMASHTSALFMEKIAVDNRGIFRIAERKVLTMSEACSGNCSGCDVDCTDRKPESFLAAPHELSQIKKVIGVVSGKGGVGKTLVTSLLAVSMQRAGYQTAVLDADITGPSIPRAFGIREKAKGSELGMHPVKSHMTIPFRHQRGMKHSWCAMSK